jgi:nitroreductase
MTAEAGQRAVPIPAGQAEYLIGTAARVPSVHNTQPWRFRVGEYVIKLHADPRRKLQGTRQ